jgi:hypothetical protein
MDTTPVQLTLRDVYEMLLDTKMFRQDGETLVFEMTSPSGRKMPAFRIHQDTPVHEAIKQFVDFLRIQASIEAQQ